MDWTLAKKLQRYRILRISLSFFAFALVVFLVSPFSYAQTLADNGDIQISASVLGCGDNTVQTSLGEQCEGPNLAVKNLNGQSCSTLGFTTGTLGCRDTCIFDTSLCTGTSTTGAGGSSTGGSKIRDLNFNSEQQQQETVIIPIVPETNLIFTGRAGPGDIVVILNGKNYFASGIASSDGSFSISVSDFTGGNYDFSFYAISQTLGNSNTLKFKTPVRENTTTQITNINLEYPKKPIFETITQEIQKTAKPLFDVLLVNVVEHEKPYIPYIIFFVGGLALILLRKLFIFLFRLFSDPYIHHYEK
jgi:hypothetical protein